MLLKPLWLYSTGLLGLAKIPNTSTNKIQVFYYRGLRIILVAPSYASNNTLHRDTTLLAVSEATKLQYKKFRNRVYGHPNRLIVNLTFDNLLQNPSYRL